MNAKVRKDDLPKTCLNANRHGNARASDIAQFLGDAHVVTEVEAQPSVLWISVNTEEPCRSQLLEQLQSHTNTI